MRTYNKRTWLNKDNSPSLGSVVAFDGDIEYSDGLERTTFLAISDCRYTAKLIDNAEPRENFIAKMELLKSEIEQFINHLKGKMNKNLNFLQALEATRQGKRVAREGWNGKGMFIFERPADELERGFIITKVKSIPQSVKDFLQKEDEKLDPSEQGLTKVKFEAYLCMYSADNSMIHAWCPTDSDLLAEDWQVLD